MLTTTTWLCDACNAQEIKGLTGYGGRPKEAMKVFYQNEAIDASGESNRYAAAPSGATKTLAAHYVFCGAGGKGNYAEQFADYIKENKLGDLVTYGSVDNKKYHPGRQCQVWIWIPDRKALDAWWRSLQGTEEAKAPIEKGHWEVVYGYAGYKCPQGCGNTFVAGTMMWYSNPRAVYICKACANKAGVPEDN